MITVNNLSIQFSGNYLFDNVSFVIADKDRIGLVGKNGAGKSTLLKTIASGNENQLLESGSIVIPKGEEIGYLPQEMVPSSTTSIMNEALSAFAEANALKAQLEKINTQITQRTDYESPEYEKILHMQYEITEYLSLINATDARAETEKVLIGLGFEHSDFDRMVSEFSTGWQMRVELAKILLKKPNVLLLDEPTNHLDIESIGWLENFLVSYYGAVVLVSHDRTFLDNITRRTIEITAGRIYDYKASYSQYVVLLQERREAEMNKLNAQQRQIAQIEKFIERFRYKATKAKQVQSRIKLVEKMELEQVAEIDTSAIHFSFPPALHSGKIVLEVKDLSKSYGDKHVLSKANMIIERGAKVAFVGKNGEGKSTLSKCIIGEIKDYSGLCRLGYNVQIGYFAQNQTSLLDPEITVFDTIDQVAQGEARTKIRSFLASFLFNEEEIDKKVKVLSGGEKMRLALCKLILSPVNLLVLDEPTNHLDMDSKNILKEALLRYEGALIVVSHDRDFLQGLTDTIYEFRHHQIKEYHGDIFEYLQRRKLQDLAELNVANSESIAQAQKEKKVSKQQYQQSREQEKEQRRKRSRISKLESQIEELENQIAEFDNRFATQADNIEESLYTQYEEKKQSLASAMQEWEELSLELDD
jgi:ATPase components of ABC transporters with duplicated ATPase domains